MRSDEPVGAGDENLATQLHRKVAAARAPRLSVYNRSAARRALVVPIIQMPGDLLAARLLPFQLTDLGRKPLDFLRQKIVLSHLSAQKAIREVDFFFEAARGEDVEICRFFAAVLEVPYLDQPLFNQGINAIIDFADADVELARQIPLTRFRMFGQML